jgi:hypothetical protein
MVMTIERTDEPFMHGLDLYPTGKLKVVGLRPATRRESIIDWFCNLFKSKPLDRADLSHVALPLGTAVSVGIELSPKTYTKLVNGDTKLVEAIDLLRNQPVSMELVVAPECTPPHSAEEMDATVV